MCVGSVGTILSREGNRATIDFGGVRTVIRTDFLPDVAVGERVLIHAGFAISRVSEQEATEMAEAWAALQTALGRRAGGDGE